MTTVLPVRFQNRDGLALFGILHLPEADRRRPEAVLLLSPGVKMRVAPGRLYNKLARRFVDVGFPVFRFDFSGLGDSEGSIDERALARVYNSIQNGRYVSDTVDAMDWLQREHGLARFVACGLCGGALTGLLTAESDHRITALLGIGIPASFEGLEGDYDQYLTRGQLRSLSRGYLVKLLQPKALLRFLTFRSSYGVVWRSFRETLLPARRKGVVPRPANPRSAVGNVNPRFAPAFLSMLRRKRPILLIFGGADRWRWEFEEKFEDLNREALGPHGAGYETHVVDNANHVLSDPEWLETALRLSEEWLTRLPAGR